MFEWGGGYGCEFLWCGGVGRGSVKGEVSVNPVDCKCHVSTVPFALLPLLQFMRCFYLLSKGGCSG